MGKTIILVLVLFLASVIVTPENSTSASAGRQSSAVTGPELQSAFLQHNKIWARLELHPAEVCQCCRFTTKLQIPYNRLQGLVPPINPLQSLISLPSCQDNLMLAL